MSDRSPALRVHPSAMHRTLQGEGVLLQLDSGEYFGLDEVGERAWELIVEYGDLSRVTQTMLEEYDVDPATLAGDLQKLVDELLERKLLQAVESDAPGTKA